MSDDVKDFAYYAGAAERVVDTIQDDWPTADVAAVAAIAQVFATLACGAPKTTRDERTTYSKAHPQCDTLHPGGHEVRTEGRCFSGESGEPGSPHSHFCVQAIFHSDEHMCECGTGWF